MQSMGSFSESSAAQDQSPQSTILKTTGFTPTDWYGRELARREELYQAGQVPSSTWEDVRNRLVARLQSS